MNYNFRYTQPSGYYCNFNNKMNDAIFNRNEQIHCTFENQLQPRSISTLPCQKKTQNCNSGNIGHMKCYSQNIDVESNIIHSKPSKSVCKKCYNKMLF